MSHLVTVNRLGGMLALFAKPGKGVDLRKFGPATMQRVSEITLEPGTQKFVITFLKGELKGRKLTEQLWYIGGDDAPSCGQQDGALTTPEGDVMLFGEYDGAVQAEVDIIQHWRKRGTFTMV